MRRHAGAQALAPESEQAVQGAQDGDLYARFDPLIAVRNPEEHSLQEPCAPPAVRKGLELFLEVAAKDQLFADSRAD